MTIVLKEMRLKTFKHVKVLRNKDLFAKYHPSDTSKDYYGTSDNGPAINQIDGLNKNQQLQVMRDYTAHEQSKAAAKAAAEEAAKRAAAQQSQDNNEPVQ